MRSIALLLLLSLATVRPAAAQPGAQAARQSVPSVAPAFPDSLGIEECIAIAGSTAPDVRAAEADLEAARFDSAAARRNRLPTASIFGAVFFAPSGFYDPVLTDLGQYEFKAGVTVPLLDGGVAARARMRAAAEAARRRSLLGLSSREAGVRAGQLAAEVLSRTERERLERASLDWVRDLADLISARVRAGTSGPADSIRIGIERDALDASLDTTRTGLIAARRELAVLLGVPLAALPAIRSARSFAPPTAADSVALVARISGSPEVRVAQAEEAQASLEFSDAAHRDALTLDLSADAGLWGSDLTHRVPEDLRATNPNATFTDRLRRDLGASATIGFRRPVLDPTLRPTLRARGSAVQAARIRSETARVNRELAVQNILDRWRAAARAISKTGAAVDRAERNLIRTKSLYAAGAATLLEVLDARRALDDANERMADARLLGWSARVETEISR